MPTDLFGQPVIEKAPLKRKAYAGTPGAGPKGETCKSCAHYCWVGNGSRHYLKCELIKSTRGPGTDIKARTPACQFWEKEGGKTNQ